MAYKDSLFRSIFSNEMAALSLYNALHNTKYQRQDIDITINTLEESLLTSHKNDLSFLVNGKLIVLVEHQSSINENMPLRFLHHILRLLEDSIGEKKDLYRRTLIRLPRPQFIVLYNGAADLNEQSTLHLSDAFENVEGFESIFLELIVKVYNINEGCNKKIASHCEVLRGYAHFVARVRFHEEAERKRDSTLKKATIIHIAIRKAIQDCKDKNLLVDYWDNLSMEEITMLGSEWDLKTALEVEREEGFEEGLEKVAQNMLKKGFSHEQTAELSGLDIEKVKKLSSRIK